MGRTPYASSRGRGTVLLPLLALGLVGASCGEDQAALIAAGEVVYAEYCALCHGPAGEGYAADAANALANPAFLAVATDSFLRDGIIRGRPGTAMSPWGLARGGPLPDEDVEALVALIRSWQTDPSLAVHNLEVDGSAQRGTSYWKAACATCHGQFGEGGSYMTVNNPEFLASVSDGFLKEVITHGRPGTPMPGFASSLTSQAIDDLVVLIRSWQQPIDQGSVVLPDADLGDPRIHPGGPAPDFPIGERYVPADQVKAALDAGEEMILIDARAPSDYVLSHVTGAVSVPFYDVAAALDQLPKEAHIVCYCGCPHAASGTAMDALLAAGYEKVWVLDEGFFVWQDRLYPVTTGPSPGEYPTPAAPEPTDTDAEGEGEPEAM